MVLPTRSDAAKEIEILVRGIRWLCCNDARHGPGMRWTDRAVIAALTRLVPARRRLGLLVTPATILRWHRQLLARRCSTKSVRAGRPAIPAGIRALVLRLATENPTCGVPPHPRRTRRTRLPDRRLHRLEDPSRRRDRPLTPRRRSDLGTVLYVFTVAGARDLGLRLVSARHREKRQQDLAGPVLGALLNPRPAAGLTSIAA
jgi:hypothetical protein